MKYTVILILSFFALSTFSQKNTVSPENELIPFKANDKWGAATIDGKVKISANYDDLSPFFHNVTKVEKDGMFGVVNTKNKEVTSITYDAVVQMIYSKKTGISIICEKDNKMMLQVGKKVIVPLSAKYENISIVVDTNHNESYYILSKKKGIVYKLDVINSKGKKVLENIVADDLKLISINQKSNNRYRYRDFDTEEFRLESDFYWWSEAELGESFVGDYSQQYISYYNEYDSRYGRDDDDENHLDRPYYYVNDFKNCFIKVKKKESKYKSNKAFYSLKGKNVFDYTDRVSNMYYLTDESILVKTFDDELNCKNPTKYGVYNLNTNAFTIDPIYHFYGTRTYFSKKNKVNNRDGIRMMELMCEHLDEIKDLYKEGIPERIITRKMMELYGVKKIEPDQILIFGNDNEMKVLDDKVNLLKKATLTEGTFIAKDFMIVNNLDSIYVGVEVFNESYRGKGILNIITNEMVVTPIYERIRDRYDEGIELSGDDMEEIYIKDFKFPINARTSKVSKGFVRALSFNIYVVTENDDEVAIYNVDKQKVVTQYIYSQEEDYPSMRTIDKKQYIFLQDKDGNFSVIDADGNVLVNKSEDEIELLDIYENGKYYFVTEEGYYGLDGTKFFK